MPELQTFVDRLCHDNQAKHTKCGASPHKQELTSEQWHLPDTAYKALGRGFRGLCPSCGQPHFFPKFLKPVELCPACQQDWMPQRADDFPAYVVIIVTGHIMAPIIIALVGHTTLPLWMNWTIILSLGIILTVSLLQPVKGAIIAFQWWMGMHGLTRPGKSDTLYNRNDRT